MGDGPSQNEHITVDYQTSSLGQLNYRFMTRLSYALRGIFVPQKGPPPHTFKDDTFRIHFPSKRTASNAPNSVRRVDLFSQPTQPGTDDCAILDQSLVDIVPGSLLSHSKIIYVKWTNTYGLSKSYVCVTSANLSPTAWSSAWECGVLLIGQQAECLQFEEPGQRYKAKDKWEYGERKIFHIR